MAKIEPSLFIFASITYDRKEKRSGYESGCEPAAGQVGVVYMRKDGPSSADGVYGVRLCVSCLLFVVMRFMNPFPTKPTLPNVPLPNTFSISKSSKLMSIGTGRPPTNDMPRCSSGFPPPATFLVST